jgi:pyrimidine-nucleoside phosphorylase
VIWDVPSPQEGYLSAVDALTIGEASVQMGAGRSKKEDAIDHRVGIIVHHKVGDRVKKDDVLFTLHASDERSFVQAKIACLSACQWQDEPCEPLPLFYEVIE